MFYVIELQTNNEGAAIVTAFPNKADALEKFYDTAKYAVKSAVTIHTVSCVNASGFNVVEPIVFDRSEAQE